MGIKSLKYVKAFKRSGSGNIPKESLAFRDNETRYIPSSPREIDKTWLLHHIKHLNHQTMPLSSHCQKLSEL